MHHHFVLAALAVCLTIPTLDARADDDGADGAADRAQAVTVAPKFTYGVAHGLVNTADSFFGKADRYEPTTGASIEMGIRIFKPHPRKMFSRGIAASFLYQRMSPRSFVDGEVSSSNFYGTVTFEALSDRDAWLDNIAVNDGLEVAYHFGLFAGAMLPKDSANVTLENDDGRDLTQFQIGVVAGVDIWILRVQFYAGVIPARDGIPLAAPFMASIGLGL